MNEVVRSDNDEPSLQQDAQLEICDWLKLKYFRHLKLTIKFIDILFGLAVK